MNTLALKQNLSRTFGKTGLKLKKHSPEILITTGIVGTVATVVLACKATLKVNEILEETKETIDTIHACAENPEMAEQYTEQDCKKDLTTVYVQTGLKFAKLYAPALIVGTASLACILASHNIVRKRNAALAAAYTTVDSSFKKYRKRVVDRFGEEIDRELKYDIKAKEIEERVVDENGNETVVTKTVKAADITGRDEYSVIFYEGNPGWDKDPELTKYFLLQQQNWANDLLKSRGYVFLNEVYEMLGFNRTAAGQVIGWYYDERDLSLHNCVDFGMFDIYDEQKIKFINGDERAIVLDFNVDGNILEYI